MAGGDAREGEICVVIGRPRSGTTVFRHMLASHPHVYSLGELFNEDDEHSLARYLERRAATEPAVVLPSRSLPNFLDYLAEYRNFAAASKPGTRLLVLDVKYDQAHLIVQPWWNLARPPRLFSLIRERGWFVVDLRRERLLDLAVSNLVAIASGTYHSTGMPDGAAQTARVRVDPQQLLNTIRATERAYALVSQQFKDYARYLPVIYEAMFEPDAPRFSASLLARLASLLGLDDRFEPRPALRKLLAADIYEHIENAAEIRAFAALHALP